MKDTHHNTQNSALFDLFKISFVCSYDEKTERVVPVTVNISIIIKDILQIKEIDHTYTLKVINPNEIKI